MYDHFLAAAFLADIEANPRDPAPKLAFADWLRDQGQTQLAYAYEWAARRGRHPACADLTRGWFWERIRKGANQNIVHRPPLIPWMIFDSLPKPHQYRKTMKEAFGALAVALFKVRYAASWDGSDVE